MFALKDKLVSDTIMYAESSMDTCTGGLSSIDMVFWRFSFHVGMVQIRACSQDLKPHLNLFHMCALIFKIFWWYCISLIGVVPSLWQDISLGVAIGSSTQISMFVVSRKKAFVKMDSSSGTAMIICLNWDFKLIWKLACADSVLCCHWMAYGNSHGPQFWALWDCIPFHHCSGGCFHAQGEDSLKYLSIHLYILLCLYSLFMFYAQWQSATKGSALEKSAAKAELGHYNLSSLYMLVFWGCNVLGLFKLFGCETWG